MLCVDSNYKVCIEMCGGGSGLDDKLHFQPGTKKSALEIVKSLPE